MVEDIFRMATLARVLPAVSVIVDDPSDNEVLACAASAEADWIISGDRHLFHLGAIRGIPILTAGDFLQKTGRR